MSLLYVLGEHPSVSQTFVVNEAAAMRALGVRVVGYALRAGKADRPAADLELICPPPSRIQLATALVRSLRALAGDVWSRRRDGLALRELPRLALAHAHAVHAAPYCSGVGHLHAHFLGRTSDVAHALAPRLGCAWTATAHASDVYAPAEPGLVAGRLRSVALVACANRGLQERLLERAAGLALPLRTHLVHCGVDTGVLRRRAPRSPEAAPLLVTVARLIATKGHWTIVESACDLMRRHPDLEWVVAGDGPLRAELTKDPRYLEVASRLRFVGSMDHEAALGLVATATAFVLPCEQGENGDSDGIPVALMEAMALGVPVVTTPVAGIPELVVEGETGFLAAPRDAGELTATLDRLIDGVSEEQLGALRDAARHKVELEFDLHREAEQLRRLLDPFLTGGTDGLDLSGASEPGIER